MRKKTKKIKKVKHKGPTMLDRLPKNRGQWLELVIKFTERAIDQGGGPYLVDQLWRLQVELEQWKKENPNESTNQEITPRRGIA